MRVAVIGAGPAGLTAAYQLSQNNISVDVYEASSRVGGFSKTLPLWGQLVDLGPHRFFSSDSRVNRLWLELIGDDYQMVNRLTRIYYEERFFTYPLKPFDALKNLGLWEAGRCTLSFFSEQLRLQKEVEDFESWVTARFGKRLFEIFFKTYSEKLWGIKCQQLDADFAAQRIRKLSLYEAIKNAFVKRDSQHKTLVEQFAYPLQGTGLVYERMKERIIENGGRVFLNQPVEGVAQTDNQFPTIALNLKNGKTKIYDHIISTMPLTKLVCSIPNTPLAIIDRCKQLKFRNTRLVYLQIDNDNLFPDNWLYVHTQDLKMGRITNFRNWVPHLCQQQKETILAVEYWCNFDDHLWLMPEDELIKLASKELAATGLLKDNKILNGKVIPIPRCYPIYQLGYKKILSPVISYLNGIDKISVIGRYGAFKYNNQDHSILMGILAADNLVNNKRHNLWAVNTDYETYQESSVITETGLVVQ